MAEEIKWIKIVTNVFEDEKILLIDGLPERDTIIVIWFKLLCLAGKQNNGGVFLINGAIRYNDEMLAVAFRRPLNLIRMALSIFERYGMIEIIDDVITIPKWEKHQALDSYEKKKERDRLYQQTARERKRAAIAGATSEGRNELPSGKANGGEAGEKERENGEKEENEDQGVAVFDKSSDSRLTSDEQSSTVVLQNKNKNNIIDIKRKELLRKEKADDEDSAAREERSCPFVKIKELYHSICVSYPKIIEIDGNRRKAVEARWRTYRSVGIFEELFRIAESSAFLKGTNDRNWTADFDWLMKATNFSKVLEHKYDERPEGASRRKEERGEGSKKSFDPGDPDFEEAMQRTLKQRAFKAKEAQRARDAKNKKEVG